MIRDLDDYRQVRAYMNGAERDVAFDPDEDAEESDTDLAGEVQPVEIID